MLTDLQAKRLYGDLELGMTLHNKVQRLLRKLNIPSCRVEKAKQWAVA